VSAAFRCGHPNVPENRYSPSGLYARCRLCQRARQICVAAERGQALINAGKPLARYGPVSRYANG
jgi:hypothetical protein